MMLSVLTMLFDWFNYIPFMHVTVSLPPPPVLGYPKLVWPPPPPRSHSTSIHILQEPHNPIELLS